MNRLEFALLATTSLTVAATPAHADMIFESVVGFGSSFRSATAVGQGDTTFVGDVNVNGQRYFELGPQDGDQAVRLIFTAARQNATGAPIDVLGSGGVLPHFLGTPLLTQTGAGGSGQPGAAGSLRITVGAVQGQYDGIGYTTASVPSLTLYEVPVSTGSTAEGATFVLGAGSTSASSSGSSGLAVGARAYYLVGQATADSAPPGSSVSASNSPITPNAPSSFELDLILAAGSSLPIVFGYDFDWTLEVIATGVNAVTDVPEPATLGLLGLGAAAAMRRRKRTI